MADYLKSTNFATKDALPSGNAGKIVKGTEIDNEFNAIADAVESKADLLNPTFSGLLTTDTLTTGGAANIGGTLAVTGALSSAADVQFTGTGRVLVPKGTTAQRPASPTSGSLRYNTSLNYLENYTGTEWKAVGFITPADVSDQANTSTGYFQVPRGTAAQRPASPLEGLVRYNSDSDIYEGYINGAWHKFVTVNQGVYTITYLVVAGGGGSGGLQGGGGAGGGGSYAASTTAVTPGSTVLTVLIGSGGSGGSNGTAGSTSSITGVATTTGGGGGTVSPDQNAGGNGGASGNGFAGANGTSGDPHISGGGGGAAGAASTNSGGIGFETLITGVASRVGGGGGGTPGGSGGLGGGGTGAGAGAGTAGGVNTGGGGGGGNNNGVNNGGSGVVYLSMPTANYTGTHTGSPTISTTGSNTVLKFTGSGTYTC